MRVGEFEQLESAVGSWRVLEGEARIDEAHADLGKRCLHLDGGSRVELRLANREAHALRFQAERWTARDPYRFAIDRMTPDGWIPIEDWTDRIRVGGFLTEVQLELPAGTEALRFRCNAPVGTGTLIDDLELVPRRPMELLSVDVVQPTLPLLIGLKHNPVLRIDFETVGNQDPIVLESIESTLMGSLEGGDAPITDLGFFPGPRDLGDLDGSALVPDRSAVVDSVSYSDEAIVWHSSYALPEGSSSIWFMVTLAEDADLDGWIDSTVRQITTRGGVELLSEPADPPGRQRLGVALRKAGDDGVPVYRIPGLVTTNDGTLIAVYDLRRQGWRDLPGNIDVGMSRSTDGGQTWEPMQVIMDFGEDPDYAFDGVGDPAILVDRESGTIWVAATWHHGPLGWNGSQPGFDPEQTGQLVLTRSDDDGLTWSAPINITRQVKEEEWAFLLQGPGRGITMQDGTLVFPAQYQLSPAKGREPRSTVLWSRDHGRTWNLGAEALGDTTEAAVVELAAGQLMLNMRDNRGSGGAGARAVAVSSDLGKTWQMHPTSGEALEEPVCMASLIHVGRELSGRADGHLLFSNPAVDAPPRRSLSVRWSLDSGLSWPEEQTLLLDAGSSAGYSCLTMIDAETVGIVYECSRAHLAFQRIPLEDLGRTSL